MKSTKESLSGCETFDTHLKLALTSLIKGGGFLNQTEGFAPSFGAVSGLDSRTARKSLNAPVQCRWCSNE
jgi:hypothetical protein